MVFANMVKDEVLINTIKPVLKAHDLAFNFFELAEQQNLDNDFVIEVKKIKDLLTQVKRDFDLFDLKQPSFWEKIKLIDTQKEQIFLELKNSFDCLDILVNSFTQAAYLDHQKYFQDLLLPCFLVSSLAQRIWTKPLGYSQDYLVMQSLFRDDYVGNSSYEILVHRFLLEIVLRPIYLGRYQYFQKEFKRLANEKNHSRIMSIGCEAASEIRDFIKNEEVSRRCEFTCLDVEDQALEFVKEEISSLRRNREILISYHNLSLNSITRKSRVWLKIFDQDLVYSFGLFDYYNKNEAMIILEHMFSLVASKEELIISALHQRASCQIFLELFADWQLVTYNAKSMLALADGLTDVEEKIIESSQDLDPNIYLKIKKK